MIRFTWIQQVYFIIFQTDIKEIYKKYDKIK